jgi:hypothetical protein
MMGDLIYNSRGAGMVLDGLGWEICFVRKGQGARGKGQVGSHSRRHRSRIPSDPIRSSSEL